MSPAEILQIKEASECPVPGIGLSCVISKRDLKKGEPRLS
jgi:hypothetical protein